MKKSYNIWIYTPPFEYSDARYECLDCQYKQVKRNYLGQWKDGQKNGRGAEIVGQIVREGYWKANHFIGKRRQLDEQTVNTWDTKGA